MLACLDKVMPSARREETLNGQEILGTMGRGLDWGWEVLSWSQDALKALWTWYSPGTYMNTHC